MSTGDLHHHAVLYNSPSVQGAVVSIQDLKVQGVNYIRILWVDPINHVKCRIVPLPYFEKLLKTSRPGTSVPKAALGIVFLTLAEGFGSTGEYLYAVDLSSLRISPYAPNHASVLGWFEEKRPHPGLKGHLALEVDLCPRTILRRIVEKAKQSGVEFLVGFETEFVLLKNTLPIEAANPHGWCSASALPPDALGNILEEIATSLLQSGIEVQMYHSEAAPGQYEVVTGPLPPLQAADALVHTRETIFNIASKHGLRATLAPRVFSDSCGNAAHTHVSVHGPNKDVHSSIHPDLSLVESTFLAGLLRNLPAITLLALPTTASFDRMVDGVWSGGTYICWGTDNREAPIRLCNAFSPSSRNFEVKCHDGTANPYLAVAGFLSAGFEGIVEGKECKIKDCGLEIELSAALLGDKGRQALGIKDRMPLTWEEARSKFEASDLIDKEFGKVFKAKYLSVNKVLKEQMTHGLPRDAELQKWVENY